MRTVPKEAQKTIGGGKLKGMTDINPMWRIKKLTEMFGVCGVGWYTEKLKEWTEVGSDGRVAAMVDINLYVKVDGEWSKPIFGTGGSMFTDMEKGNLVSNDEAYKMAYTDAISVACKALGMGADVYWQSDRQTKYDRQASAAKEEPKEQPKPEEPKPATEYVKTTPQASLTCESCHKPILGYSFEGRKITPEKQADMSFKRFGQKLCLQCSQKLADSIKHEKEVLNDFEDMRSNAKSALLDLDEPLKTDLFD